MNDEWTGRCSHCELEELLLLHLVPAPGAQKVHQVAVGHVFGEHENFPRLLHHNADQGNQFVMFEPTEKC
jgi:hypothetical protein